jgi:hypothetical protein
MTIVQEGHLDFFTSPELRQFESKRYLAERSRALARCSRRALRAEKHLAIKRNQQMELQCLLSLGGEPEDDEHHPYRTVQQQLKFARAVRETLEAERKVVAVLCEIAELHLQASSDAVDAVNVEVLQADQLLGALLEKIISQGFMSTSPRVSPTLDRRRTRKSRRSSVSDDSSLEFTPAE